MTGIVFDIQHYCIHDGPGIRTNVFLKGCPLRCLWCQNPESQQLSAQIMYQVEKCTVCGKCVDACPEHAITLEFKEENEMPEIKTNRGLCTACGKCVQYCPNEARRIVGEEMTLDSVFKKVEQDKLFFGKDGGVTVTGGEPLAQWEFARAVLKRCKENGINTCIETCGYGNWPQVETVMEYVDLVLYDIKHMDTVQHKKCTGVGNEKILENIKRISQEMNKEIIIRVPVIPGYNDTSENIEQLGNFIKEELPTCIEVNLLPFHNMGESKKQQLDRSSEEFSSVTPSDERMEQLKNVLRSSGIAVK